MALVSPLSVYLKCTAEQVLAGALAHDLYKLRSSIKELRQVRAGTGADIPEPSAPDQSLALTGSVHSPFMMSTNANTADPYLLKMRNAGFVSGTGSSSNIEGSYRGPVAPGSPNPTQIWSSQRQRQQQGQEPISPQEQQRKSVWSVKKNLDGSTNDIERQHDRDMI